MISVTSRFLFLCCAFASWLAVANDDKQVFVSLKPDVEIVTSFYRLGEIVVHRQTTLDSELLGIRLGRTPKPGQLKLLSRYEIGSWLERIEPGYR